MLQGEAPQTSPPMLKEKLVNFVDAPPCVHLENRYIGGVQLMDIS
jgi:hypothetical protein